MHNADLGSSELPALINEQLLFHGTSKQALAAICTRGFDATCIQPMNSHGQVGLVRSRLHSWMHIIMSVFGARRTLIFDHYQMPQCLHPAYPNPIAQCTSTTRSQSVTPFYCAPVRRRKTPAIQVHSAINKRCCMCYLQGLYFATWAQTSSGYTGSSMTADAAAHAAATGDSLPQVDRWCSICGVTSAMCVQREC